jgi:hypothetical protein
MTVTFCHVQFRKWRLWALHKYGRTGADSGILQKIFRIEREISEFGKHHSNLP